MVESHSRIKARSTAITQLIILPEQSASDSRSLPRIKRPLGAISYNGKTVVASNGMQAKISI